MFHKYKKGFISLFLALAVMLSCCVPVFATITEQRFSYYTTYTYTDEPILPRSYALGRGGDVLYETYNAMNYGSFTTLDPIRITTIGRDSTTGKISSIKMEFTNIDYWYIYVHNDGDFHINVHDTKESDYTTFYSAEVYSIDDTKTRFAKFDWDNVIVTCPDIKKGDTFTYYDLQKNLQTIIFDGNGGIVGYGNSNEDDNPFGDLTEQEYPDFSLPEFHGKDISEYVDFETIIDSIQGLDVVGAVTGVLNALKGGFQYITYSVINIVSHLALTLVSLFDWLKETLPILFGNMVVKLNPYFENLYNALKLIESAITNTTAGEFIFDQEGLFGKLDNLSDLSQKIKDIFTENFINALLLIPDLKTSIENWFSAIKTVFNTTKDKIFDLYDSFILFKDTFKIMLSEEINVITTFFDVSNTNVKSLISARYEDFQLTFADKFPILKVMNSVKIAVESSFNENDVVFSFPDVTFPLHDGKTLTINGFTVTTNITKKIRIFTDPIIIGIVYLSTFNFFRNAIPDLIGGVGGGVHQAGDSISQAVYDEQHKNRTKIGF